MEMTVVFMTKDIKPRKYDKKEKPLQIISGEASS
jgi:hypothetical protein